MAKRPDEPTHAEARRRIEELHERLQREIQEDERREEHRRARLRRLTFGLLGR
jgi:hypothetical protein